MRVLIVSVFFPPVNSIASLRPYSFAKYLSQSGLSTTVLTTEKATDPKTDLSFPKGAFELIEIPLPSFIAQIRKSGHANFPAAATSLPVANRSFGITCKNALRKFLHYLKYKKGILNACRMPDLSHFWVSPAFKAIQKKGPFDIVISSAGPYPVHILAEKLKRKGIAKKWIADYRDTWSDNFVYPGLFPFNLIEKLLERWLLRSADAVTVVSDPLRKTMESDFSHQNVHVIENGFDTSDLETLPKEPIFPSDGKFRIVYTGSIYLDKRDPSPLFEAIHHIAKNGAKRPLLNHLEVLFAGSEQANLKELIQKWEVGAWVKQTGLICREDALRMQRDAHLLLFLPWNDLSVDGILTGKLFEYLFSKTEILSVGATALEASQRLIIELKAGQSLFTPQEIQTLLETRLSAISKKTPPVQEDLLHSYTREAQTKKLFRLITDTVA